jgi:hypothetical protein
MNPIPNRVGFFHYLCSKQSTMAGAKELDFSNCRYNPNDKNFKKDITGDIPEFNVFKSEHAEKVFAYVVMLFDKKSPLWAREPEYFQRKILAAELAKLPLNGQGNWSDFSKEILEGQNQEVNALVVSYLANTGDIDYMMLINELVMFHGYTMQVLDNKYDERAYKTLKDLSDGISDRTRKIFGSGEYDELARVRILLYESAEKDRQRLNPEAIVKMIDRDGDVPRDWNRYGIKYQVEPMKVIIDEHTQG